MIFFKYLGQVSIGKYITNVIFRVIVVCFIAFIFDYFLINPANAFFELLLNVIIEVLFVLFPSKQSNILLIILKSI